MMSSECISIHTENIVSFFAKIFAIATFHMQHHQTLMGKLEILFIKHRDLGDDDHRFN